MGVPELRSAFNEVAAPRFAANKVRMWMDRLAGLEYQKLSFEGTDAAGQPFRVESERLPGNANLLEAARAMAQKMVDDAAQ